MQHLPVASKASTVGKAKRNSFSEDGGGMELWVDDDFEVPFILDVCCTYSALLQSTRVHKSLHKRLSYSVETLQQCPVTIEEFCSTQGTND